MRQGEGPVVVVLDQVSAYQRLLTAGLRGELEPHGIPIVLHLWNMWESAPPPSLLRLIRSGRLRGLVTIPLGTDAACAQMDELIEGAPDLPTVYIGRQEHTANARSVRSDNAGGMRLLADHLVGDCGARRILVVRGPSFQVDSREREVAFRMALAEHGVPLPPELVVDGMFHRERAYRAVWAALQSGRRFDAVAAFNDQTALGAIDAVRAFGLEVPDDLVVTGFDDEETTANSGPTLTTVNQNLSEQGAAAARLLLDMAAGRSTSSVHVPVRLVVRGSTTTAPQVEDDHTETPVSAAALRTQVTKLDTTITLSRTFMACTTVEEVIDQLGASLPRLDINRVFLVLRRDEPGPPTGQVVLAHFDGTLADVSRERPFGLEQQLLPDHLSHQLRRDTLTLQPLSVGELDMGYLLIDRPSERDDLLNEVLRLDMIRTMEGLRSMRRISERAEELERLVAQRTEELQREVTTRRRAEEQLRRLNNELRASLHLDGLTGIANRAAFDDALAVHWAGHNRSGQPLSLIMVDVDHFKAYNDRHGHLQGDEALRVVARCLAGAVKRQGDLAARYGGEEFALVLPSTTAEGARMIADRIQAALAEREIPHLGSPVSDRLTISIGVATAHPAARSQADELIAAADQALYQVKHSGRNGIATGPPVGPPPAPVIPQQSRSGETAAAPSS